MSRQRYDLAALSSAPFGVEVSNLGNIDFFAPRLVRPDDYVIGARGRVGHKLDLLPPAMAHVAPLHQRQKPRLDPPLSQHPPQARRKSHLYASTDAAPHRPPPSRNDRGTS